jgi:multiple sugar transport system substrate-binding protein
MFLRAFEEAGLSESDIPKTWDQFLEIAHQLTKGERFGCLFETAPGYYQTLTWYPFMWQGGGEIATPDGKRSVFASPATVQALKFWQDAIQQNVAPRKILGSGGGDVIANLVSGFCAMQNLGIWGVSVMREFAKDFPFGVFPLPFTSQRPAKKYFRRLGLCRQCEGQKSRGSGKVLCLGSGFHAGRLHSKSR